MGGTETARRLLVSDTMGRVTKKVGDCGPLAKISFVVKDSEGTVINLTGYTVTLIVAKTSTFYFSGECDLDDAANGECSYEPADGDFADEEEYNMQLKITKSTTDVVYLDAGVLKLEDPLPES